jgi:superfamily II DNA or RNA helicase
MKSHFNRKSRKKSLNKMSLNKRSLNKVYLREYQMDVVKFINNPIHNSLLVVHGTGHGKCEGYDTPNLMFDGTIKMVQDIVVGDLLMGPDSRHRKVLGIGRGKDIMYNIVPNKGEIYTFNSEHILSLKWSDSGVTYVDDKRHHTIKKWCTTWFNNTSIKTESKYFEFEKEAREHLNNFNEKSKICNISIIEYLKLSKKMQNQLKLYRTGVDFPEKEVPFDPYIIGLWIGDGSSATNEITNQDSAVIIYLKRKLSEYNMHLDFPKGSKYIYRIAECDKNIRNMGLFNKFNKFTQILRDLNLLNNKHIPNLYKINSRKIRLELLAGLLDSDGHLLSDNSYEFTQKNETTMDEVIFLARSLGFSAYKSIKKTSWTYKGIKKYGFSFRTTISGNINEIPCKIERKKANEKKQKKDVMVTGFKIVEKGIDNYYGFTLDDDHLYLLGNFTVTHNTISAVASAECYLDKFPNSNVIVISPAALILNFKKEMYKYGAEMSDNYHFYSFDKFMNTNSAVCNNSMIIIDEVHNMRNMKVRYDAIYKCIKQSHKLLILTATPFVNSLLDFIPIINFLYRDDEIIKKYQKNILDVKPQKINFDNQVAEYFKDLYNDQNNYNYNYNEYRSVLENIAFMLHGKVSFINDKNSIYFPIVKIHKINLTMSRDFYKKYANAIMIDKKYGKSPEKFYSGYRQAINDIGDKNYISQKFEKISEILDKNTQTLIFTNWLENGIDIIMNYLDNTKISYGVITGKVNPNKRMETVEAFNEKQFQVLLITKAGSEGLDLKGTRNIILTDPVWNPSTLEQIIGRGVRFMSHHHLPESQRNVNVYLLCLNSPKFAPVPSGDQLLYSILEEKEIVKKDIEKILKTVSI